MALKRIMPFLLLLLLTGAVPSSLASKRGGDDQPQWKPVTPEELKLTTARVEPGADAEAIFWEVRIDDRKYAKLSYEHYIRIKIFTEKGREKYAKFDIPFEKGNKVEDIAARIIKPDGSITELNPNDIFEQEIIKADKVKIKAKSFAVPGIEPGVIVEYQYREILKNEGAGGKQLVFQRDIPVQQLSYYIRPAKFADLRAYFFNMQETRFTDAGDGFYVIKVADIPAFREEPHMPPVNLARRWALLKYSGFDFSSMFLGTGFQAFAAKAFKPTGNIKDKAGELINGVTSDDEKLHRIYAFVQGLKNLSFDPSVDQKEKEKIDDPDEVLKRSRGSEVMLDMLFASLCRAAGFESSIAMSGDRSRKLYAPSQKPAFTDLHFTGIAVKTAHGYTFFSPGIPYMPYGRLLWWEENVPATLLSGDKQLWTETVLSPCEASRAHRTGKFKLSENGTLEGTVELEYTGHQGIARRRDDFFDSPTERQETIKEQIKRLSNTAEVSDVSVLNFDDTSKPLTYTLKVRVPNYAQKTGKRLFLQPEFFEYGSTPEFSSTSRKFDVWFAYPWSELDEIEIQLPKGYALDSADSPADVADSNQVASQQIRMRIDAPNNILKFHREFYFGRGAYTFPVALYPAIKELFEAFQIANTHIVTLKQTAN